MRECQSCYRLVVADQPRWKTFCAPCYKNQKEKEKLKAEVEQLKVAIMDLADVVFQLRKEIKSKDETEYI